MNIIYIFHSCFMIELDESIIIFDYYKGNLPIISMDAIPNKKVYFFASHTHPDHFNHKIFAYSNEKVKYILSHDIKEKIVYRNMLYDYPNVNITYLKANENYRIDELSIQTYKSTDRGVAFLVETEGKRIFHAGDLYPWINEKLDKAKSNDMLARFKRELSKMNGIQIDAGFFPLDGRLGKYYAMGFDMYAKAFDVKHIFPMHMWEEYELINKVKAEAFAAGYAERIESPDTEGKIVHIG